MSLDEGRLYYNIAIPPEISGLKVGQLALITKNYQL